MSVEPKRSEIMEQAPGASQKASKVDDISSPASGDEESVPEFKDIQPVDAYGNEEGTEVQCKTCHS